MKKIFLSVLIISFSLSSSAQLVTVTEFSKNNDSIPVKGLSIVDINSNLVLNVNSDSITARLSSSVKANEELLKKLNMFKDLLSGQKEIVRLLSQDLSRSTTEEKRAAIDEFADKMLDLYDKIFANKDLEERFLFYIREYKKKITSDEEKKKYHEYYIEYAIEQVNLELARDLKVMQQNIDREKIRIQISAFLNTKAEKDRKVHIENYDDYRAGEFYEVERFVTSFTKEDIAAFDQTKELAAELNKAVDNNFATIGDFLKSNIQSYACVENIIGDINTLYNDRDKLLTANQEIGSTFLLDVKDEYQKLANILSVLKNWDGKNQNALELFNATQQNFIEQAKRFPGRIEALVLVLPDDLKKKNKSILDLHEKIKACKVLLDEDLKQIIRVEEITTGLLVKFKRSAETGTNIANGSFAYSIQDLPKLGFINLKSTGKRSNGDQLEIQLIVKTQDDLNNHKPGIIIEKHILTLQQINVYSESNVSLILASPFNYSDNVKLEHTFQFAPSGSLLFKFGSRKCKTWNFLEPAFGFSMSTPDFDLDGVPEIGLGGVFTILKDVLSVGLSYNTKTDNPYWFFGISLPFSTLGMPINTIQTNAGK